MGKRNPSANARPPANSANADTYAQNGTGRRPMRAMPCVQPARPGPPHTPRTFCAPCAPMTRPTTARTRAKARSVLMTVVVKVISDPSQVRLRSENARQARTYSRASSRARGRSLNRPVARLLGMLTPSMWLDHVVICVSDFARASAFYRAVLGAEIIERDGRIAYRIGEQQLNVHGPGVRPVLVARVPVAPGNSDICFEWEGPIEGALAYLASHGVAVEA